MIEIAGRKIGAGHPVFVIAEMSANHNQNFGQAVEIIKAAKKSGADAVKLQTYTPDTITIDCHNDFFSIKGTVWEGINLFDLYKKAYTPWDWQPRLKKIAEEQGICLFSSPFDPTAVDFLENAKMPAYKISSFEIIDIPLLQRIARTRKPVIMSTGMASLEEIHEAVTALRDAGCEQLALLKCTSAYPSPPGEMNLKTIVHLARTFQVPAGLSDHTLGTTIPVAAVALGACIIEKHFTLSRSEPGPDSAFSLEPAEFKSMVAAVRETERALGQETYEVTESQKANRAYRRSLFVVADVKQGEKFTGENVRSIRPGNGLHPRYLQKVLGKKARVDVPRGTPFSWSVID
ncbi:MAG: pseudaminic acid synthase [Thermodesulfovibrionia bacterium]|nr:pseudaminic acid synthase [Thermodesulfovibrionia bacterium]